LVLVLAPWLAGGVSACSSDDSGAPGGADAGHTPDGSIPSVGDSGGTSDSGPVTDANPPADSSAGDGDAGAGDAAPFTGKLIMDDVSWPEGPLYTAGVVRWVGYGSGDVWQWDGKTVTKFWHQDGCGPSAIIDLPNGEYLVTCYDSNTLGHVSAAGTTIENIKSDSADGGFLGPNDFAKDAKGGIYFTASGVFAADAGVEGTVYYRASDGTIKQVASNIHYSNGLVMTDDGATLLVNEHLEAQVLKYSVQSDGSLTNRQVFVRMKDVVPTPPNALWSYGCDGVKRDSKGNIYVANYGGSRLVVVDGAGKLVTTIPVPYADVDNVGFGPDLSATGPDAGPSDSFLYIADVKDDSTAPYPGAIFQLKNPVP
jgi:sugar lactone lactonase YvrE